MLDSTGRIFRPSKEIVNDLNLFFLAQISVKSPNVWMAHKPPWATAWDVAAASLIKLPNTKNYIWVNQKSGLTWPGNRTKLFISESQTVRYFTIFSTLTDWRYINHEIFQILGIIDSALTLSLNYSSLFSLCGNE